MILYPAVDIYNGKCVRLMQGKFDQATVYFDNPLDAAKKWADLGAAWLHVVDLNGALEGKPVNLKAIEAILTSIDLPIQIGGGIRSEETAEIFLTMGAGRVVLGSAALEDPDLVQILCLKYDDRVAVGIDAREGRVAVRGWTEVLEKEATVLAQELKESGLGCVVYTDISRDGTMSGPNFEAIRKMMAIGLGVIASGGIASLEDLQMLKGLGVSGAILGRALYEGKVDLKEALKIC